MHRNTQSALAAEFSPAPRSVSGTAMTLSEEARTAIEEEEETLRRIVADLQSQRTIGQRRLHTEEERAQDLTSQIVASRRDVEKQMLASDEAVSHGLANMKRTELKSIDKLLERPYFARLVVEEEDERGGLRKMEFRLGSVANSDCRIIDWRKAPISKLYYEYREGDDYCEIIQGRERNGRVLLRNNVEIEHGELRRLTCRLGTFERRNNEWIATSGAGTRQSAANYAALPDVLSLISPEQFRAITVEATSSVLIQGVAGSGKTTVALYRLSWLVHEGNSDIKLPETLVLLRSPALKGYIERSLPSVQLEGAPVQLFGEWAEKLAATLVPGLTDTNGRFARPKFATPPGALRVLYSLALLRALSEAAKPFASLPPAEFRGLLRVVLEHPNAILQHDETKLLDREVIAQARQLLSQTDAAGVVHPAEDLAIIHLAQTRGVPLVPGRTASGKYRHIVVDEIQDFSAAELAIITGSVESLAQLTLVGDRSQAIDEAHVFPGWERLRQFWAFDEAASKYVQLAVSHRSTVAVMRLAYAIQGSHEPVQGPRAGKPPLWYHCRNEDFGVEECLGWISRVSERFPESLVAVLCRDREEAKYAYSLLRPTFQSAVRLGDETSISFEEGVIVSWTAAVKGLEFPNVLIWNPTAKHYGNDRRSRNLLYVAVTRTQEHLCLVSWGDPSPLLPSLESSLVRGIPRGFDPEDQEEEEDDRPLFPPLPGDEEESD